MKNPAFRFPFDILDIKVSSVHKLIYFFTMTPQYRIFYSWQSDNPTSREFIEKALDEVVEKFKKKRIHVIIEQGGGGCGFISIEESIRIKIRRSDIFVGDVTPVGLVNKKSKLLPNANVMFEMGL